MYEPLKGKEKEILQEDYMEKIDTFFWKEDVKSAVEGLKQEIIEDFSNENDDLTDYEMTENAVRKDILKLIDKRFEDVIK